MSYPAGGGGRTEDLAAPFADAIRALAAPAPVLKYYISLDLINHKVSYWAFCPWAAAPAPALTCAAPIKRAVDRKAIFIF
jgi:hypothetical protein